MLVRVQPSRPLSGSRQIGKASDYQPGHYILSAPAGEVSQQKRKICDNVKQTLS